MRVLITGGAGFIGSHLARALTAAGHQVVVFDNLHPQVHPMPPPPIPGTERIVGDVRDRQALKPAVQAAEAIVHLAALTGVGQSMYQVAEYTDVNVTGTATLLDILANESHPVLRLVLASSRAVYGEGAYTCAKCGPVHIVGRDRAALEAGAWEPRCPHCTAPLHAAPTPETHPPAPTSIYAISKLAQEQLAHAIGAAYGLAVVVLRFFNVYGPGQSLANPYTGILSTFFNRLQAGKSIEVYEDGQESRDLVHVGDVVRACTLALTQPAAAGQAINVGSGRAVTVLEIAQALARLAGRPADIHVSGRFRIGDIRHCRANIARAQQLLDYTPSITLDEGIASFQRWAVEQQGADQSEQAERELATRGLFRHGKDHS